MERIPVTLSQDEIPSLFSYYLDHATVYDSSCSCDAKVYYLDNGPGYYLKTAPKHSLKMEAQMTEFFHKKSLGPQVLAYESTDRDWLLTQRIPGEDCIWQPYLDCPVKLCDTLATLLRMLHGTDATGCPVTNRTADYLACANHNCLTQKYDASKFPGYRGFTSAAEAWNVVQNGARYLKADVLIHGDYCLPNIILNQWKFSGFIDLGFGGIGDLHIDLYWAVWSLWYNLKTDKYTDRFLDAYGRDRVEPELLRTVAAIEVFG